MTKNMRDLVLCYYVNQPLPLITNYFLPMGLYHLPSLVSDGINWLIIFN